MSFKLMVKAFDAKVGNSTRKLVLIKLADQANDDGVCWPSYETIAEACEVERRTVIRHVKKLQEAGYLRIEHVYNTDTKQNSSNRYHLTIDEGIQKSLNGSDKMSPPPVSDCHQGSDKMSPPPVSDCHQGSDKMSPKPINESINDESINESSIGGDNQKNGNADISSGKSKTKSKKEKVSFEPREYPIPSYIDKELWIAYHDMRDTKNAKATEYACYLLVKKFEKWHQEGLDVTPAIEASIISKWTDVFKNKTAPLQQANKTWGNNNANNQPANQGFNQQPATKLPATKLSAAEQYAADLQRQLDQHRQQQQQQWDY